MYAAQLTEVVDKDNIESFHDNASRDENTPRDSLGIQLDALHEGHLLFLLGRRARMVDNIRMSLARIRSIEMSLWGSSRDLFVRHDSTKAGTENNKKNLI